MARLAPSATFRSWSQLSFLALIVALALGSPGRLAAVIASPACTSVFTTDGNEVSPGCGCVNGSGSLPDTGDWGRGSGAGTISAKALPGTICQMNVGNVSSLLNGVKIDNCSDLTGRALEVAGGGCDVITVVELMSTHQCAQFCVPPTGDPVIDLSNYLKCQVCQGCPSSSHPAQTAGCQAEASVVCPASDYDIHCSEAPDSSVGCDCVCVKKTHDKVCGALPPSCTEQTLRVADRTWTDKNGQAHNCDAGNYSTCVKCTDPNGGPSMGHCVVHPDHCNNGNDDEDRERCLEVCSTGLANLAADALNGLDVRTFTGDFNCIPPSQGDKCDGGWVSIAACPWLDSSDSFRGMQVCHQTGGTAAVGEGGLGGGFGSAGNPNCMLDFVLSTDCDCGSTNAVLDGITYGDHRTIIYGRSQPTVEYVPGSGHILNHGHSTILANGTTTVVPFSSEDFGQAFGYSCGTGASCGGAILAQDAVCESHHQSIVRQATCNPSHPLKALLCETATAWGWASGQANGHGAETADTAAVDATASGGGWQAQCKTKRRVIDLSTVSGNDLLSSPFTVLGNANASCTQRVVPPPTPVPADPATNF